MLIAKVFTMLVTMYVHDTSRSLYVLPRKFVQLQLLAVEMSL